MSKQTKSDEPDPNKFFKWTVEIEVNEVWVADGFQVTEEGLRDAFQEYFLPLSTEGEVKVAVVKTPTVKALRKAQGYPA